MHESDTCQLRLEVVFRNDVRGMNSGNTVIKESLSASIC